VRFDTPARGVRFQAEPDMFRYNFSDLFERGLENAWDCEHILQRVLPRMIAAASSQQLKQALDFHLTGIKGHIYCLEKTFTRLDRMPSAKQYEPVRTLVSECEKMIYRLDRSSLLDAALIHCINQIERSEIALYESLADLAGTLGFEEIGEILNEILGEGHAMGSLLMRHAEGSVNRAAAGLQNMPVLAVA
jgi:ferritin-like metal-binding protein YciE